MTASLTLNFPGGSANIVLPAAAVRQLDSELQTLIERLRTVTATGGKKLPQPPTEYRFTEALFFEVFCNPNLWPSLFAARVLISLKTDQVRLSFEVELSQLRADVQQYLQAV